MKIKYLKKRITELESTIDYYIDLVNELEMYIGTLESQIEGMERDYVSPSYVLMLEQELQIKKDLEEV